MSEKAVKSASHIQSVGRALAILELFDDRRPALSISEIGQLSGLNRGTTYRFCQTLRGLGYLEETDDRRLRPGLKSLSLARAALASRELPELAMPYLRNLQEQSKETVSLGLMDKSDVVYVVRLATDRLRLGLALHVGSRIPLVVSSMGRAMLSHLSEEEARALIEQSDPVQMTDKTVTNVDRLLSELRHSKTRGFAVSNGQLVTGLVGIAAAVLDGGGRPIAGVNISLPAPLAPDVEATLGKLAMETAQSISQLVIQLGLR